jgi:hemerythrin
MAFHWNDRFCIGDETIDNQHRYLFSLANALAESDGNNAMTANVMKLFRYVREHFSYEEAVMRRIGYPELHEHAALHDDLITQLSALSERIFRGRLSNQELDRFMNFWLLNHIVQVDTKLSEYMSALGRDDIGFRPGG